MGLASATPSSATSSGRESSSTSSTAASRDPEWDHEVIREELRAHDPALLEKPMLVAFNKLDLPAARDAWPAFAKARRAEGAGVVGDRRRDRGGARRVPRRRRRASCRTPKRSQSPPEPAGVVVHRIESMPRRVRHRTRRRRRVPRPRQAHRTDRAQTNFDIEESAERFQRDLERMGIDAELRRAGVTPGDLVRIGGSELEWEPKPWEDA